MRPRSRVRFAAGRQCLLLLAAALAGACSSAPRPSPVVPRLDPRFSVGSLLYRDDFENGLGRWRTELEQGGTIAAAGGEMDIDVPAGCTVWFLPELRGPVLIEYEATAVAAGGPNDRVSDLNCFWMARDARDPTDLFAVRRSGKFADYNQLLTYYVGLGGNGNTTTRFRRYVGDRENRPLLPQHDLRGAGDLLVPNRSQTLGLVACGNLIQFYRDGNRLFELIDPNPYTSGWFALRTVKSHLRIRHFRVYALKPACGARACCRRRRENFWNTGEPPRVRGK